MKNLLAERDRDIARLEGQCDELRRRLAEIDAQLDIERRRAIRLELERDPDSSALKTARAA
jgi:hypothetical protein